MSTHTRIDHDCNYRGACRLRPRSDDPAEYDHNAVHFQSDGKHAAEYNTGHGAEFTNCDQSRQQLEHAGGWPGQRQQRLELWFEFRRHHG